METNLPQGELMKSNYEPLETRVSMMSFAEKICLRSNLKAKRGGRSRTPGPHGESLRVYLLHTQYMETTYKSSLENG